MTTSALQALQAPVLLRLQHLPHQRARRRRRRRARAGSADRRRCRAATGRPGRASFAAIVSGAARSEPSAKSTRDASRSNSSASSVEMPRWRRPLCACVNASAKVRAAALGSRYLLRERLGRLAIGGDAGRERQSRTDAPGRQPDALAQADDRIEHDAGRARQRAAVERQRDRRCRGRGRGSARDRFPIRPAPAAGLRGSATWTAHAAGSPRIARTAMAEQRRAVGRYSVSRNSLPNAGCARSSAGGARTISA